MDHGEEGPDRVAESDALTTTQSDMAVKLRIGYTGTNTLKFMSIPTLFQKITSQYPNRVAMVCRNEDGTKTEITYKEYAEAVKTCTKAFLKLGLNRHQSVGILGFNSKEWLISYLAAIHAGGFAFGIYLTNSAEACRHCLEISKANIVVVEDDAQLQKILEVKNQLPELKAIIQYAGVPTVPGIYSWEDMMKMGNEEPDHVLEEPLKSIAVNKCCCVVFTSGTVGYPKAAMLSHDNLIWIVQTWMRECTLFSDIDNVIISYLPLSHLAGQILDIHLAINLAATVHFAEKDALKGTIMKTLQEVRPTIFFSVPRMFEKMYEHIVKAGEQTGFIKKMVFEWARRSVYHYNSQKMNGQQSSSLSYAVASSLVTSTVKKALGLDKCYLLFTGAAPFSTDVRKFFMSLDMTIKEVYGLTESCALISFTNDVFKFESAGKPLTGIQVKIHNPDEAGIGEICSYARSVFMGYINDREKTNEAIDEGGWLHTGDLGKLDEDGFLCITGRLKELIITSGGENIPPVLIESYVKEELPCVSNAMLVGDRRKFLTILLTLKTEVNNDTGAPTDELTPQVKEWCEKLDCKVQTVTELLKRPNEKVMAAIQIGLDKANSKAISRAHKVQKFAILPRDFSVFTGELGPTMKTRRHVVLEKYSDIIENFYSA